MVATRLKVATIILDFRLGLEKSGTNFSPRESESELLKIGRSVEGSGIECFIAFRVVKLFKMQRRYRRHNFLQIFIKMNILKPILVRLIALGLQLTDE